VTDFFVDGAVGNDANAGTSEGAGNAWLTIDKGMNTVSDGDTVYIKASATYTELVTIDNGAKVDEVTAFIGYTTVITDNGQITIDGSGSNNYGITTALTVPIYYHFANIIVQNSTGTGFNIGTSADNTSFFNCVSESNSNGFIGDNNMSYLQCTASNNTTDGFQGDNYQSHNSCQAFANGANNFLLATGAIVDSLAYGLTGTGDINIFGDSGNGVMVAGCTVDGENVTGVNGIELEGINSIIVNNIIYDCDQGVEMTATRGRVPLAGYNLLNSNTSDYGGNVIPIPGTDVSGAPQFEDEANDDYSLADGSPAIDAGTDASDIV